jgi:hypothetical protein
VRLTNLIERDRARVTEKEVVASPLGNEPVEQLSHGIRRPGDGVHAVRHRAHRKAGKHFLGDFLVPVRHGVDEPRAPEREIRHVELAVRPELGGIEQARDSPSEDGSRQLGGKRIVSGRHRGMRRENALPRDRLDVPDRRRPLLSTDASLEEGEYQERCMTLVDMVLKRNTRMELSEQRRSSHA